MKFSCLMSVYRNDSPKHFDGALRSVWDAQSVKPDEIVLVCDGPLTPGLDAVISEWCEKLSDRLRVLRLAENVGLGAALNHGLEHCRNDLVARMDADDESLPIRFEQQVALMAQRPDIAACSGWIEELDHQGGVFSVRKLPAEPDELCRFAQKRSPLAHPVTMYRKVAVLDAGGYPPLRKSQDYGLWAAMLVKDYRMANVQAVLYRMRMDNAFTHGRGMDQLRHEINMFLFQRRIGFIGWYAFSRNVLIRCVLRLSPRFIKEFLYRHAR